MTRRFVTRFGGQVVLLALAMGLFLWLLPKPELIATKLVAGLLVLAALAGLWAQLKRTNQEIARFITAIVHGDVTQNFVASGRGSGFDELGRALGSAITTMRADRAAAVAENRFAAALADEAPVPLLAIGPDRQVELANKAARRIFYGLTGGRIDDFRRYGETLVAALDGAAVGKRQLCRVVIDGLPQRAMLATTRVERQGVPWRIVSIQVIQSELNNAELAVQADLVRVLTHEIMNSMTPVTSLAETAAATMRTLDPDDPHALEDARAAVETLARRATGIMQFVGTYRQFTRAPSLTVSRFSALPWAEELMRLFAATPAGAGVAVDWSVLPTNLKINGDANLLAQVVLNLLKNGAEAAADHGEAPRVALAIEERDGGRVRIAIADNGPGIAPERREEIFLPFYTTKREGTGVGLSLARQVVSLHKGYIGVADTDGGGTVIEILL